MSLKMDSHVNVIPYRQFLARIEMAKLRKGSGQWRLVGNGLVVPHPTITDSREWEKERGSSHFGSENAIE